MANDTQDRDEQATTAAAANTSQPLPKGVVLGKDGKPQAKTMTALSTGKPVPAVKKRTDCPPDVVALGRSSWTLLHSIAATYPEKPTPSEQSDVISFMKLFSKLYPCWVCAEDFQEYIERKQIKAGSRDEFGNWLCEAHNGVNKKLGKKTFDCSRWLERWRDGWKDGSCD
ncbi:uncharacterized protein PODANS_5_5710 [Podospora anserina S mat+]|uniref:Sulfhydryl oxidase n=2 Tax=Podospora anserina TaxID=2587412 RepID=B2VLC9_PODAN|nr:uncharacterized protein PODANS_5_5710 [Podospora anserina S mat+]CAD60726.1 unnamed protein product [Podospora anserina]CAP49245.1 unnamed protein product [Podospora anserina S mat+]CDP29549.1 Putative FAD-linked sulfhydryl oxidase ALR [Podospora anserina S mat+]